MLTLEDGTDIAFLGQPAQGTRHALWQGREHRSGDSVVVKIELIPGVLAIERLALDWVGAHGGPVPTLRAASTVVLPDGRRAACLVMDPIAGCARLMSSAKPPALGPLVVTHGDPGPGNFLDNGHTGTLIDWEEAQVAPRGLDLGRAMFIALLGSGPAGFVARDHHARARAVAGGYLAGLRDTWVPRSAELRWWLTVAGIQFAHRRRQRAGQPGVLPWTDAITVLDTALRDDRPWMPALTAPPPSADPG